MRLPMTLLSQFTPGELVARYTSISKTVSNLDVSLSSLILFFIPVINCWLIALFNWKLALLQIFSVLLLLYVMRKTSSLQKKLAMNLEITEANLQNVTMTGMSNLETIKSLGDEQFFFTQWESTYAQAMNARITTTSNSIFLSAVPQLVLQLTNAATICLGIWFILQGELTPGMLLASQGLISESIFPINKAIDSILLMDEGTSALDPKTEAQVMKHLYDMGITLIMIAHRLSTIEKCNRIIVLKDGRVAADGNFEQLKALGYFSNDKDQEQ
jgi:ABC-type bacteriocin/lantibiotic exporter with double-glycine peptidase domain